MDGKTAKSVLYNIAAAGLREDVTGPRIPYVQQFSMLRDRKRTEGLRRVIEELVQPGMRVLDLGAGSGILSLLAARAGAIVTALEIQRAPAELAQNLGTVYFPDRVTVIREEARQYKPEEPFDLILCEMIDTWLIRELQVQVMNHALEHCLAPGGQVMPLRACCYVEPVEVDYGVEGFEIPLPHYETSGMTVSKNIGERVQVKEFDFMTQEQPDVRLEASMSVFEYGVCNGLRLSMTVDLGAKLTLKGSDWFSPALILPVVPQPLTPGGELAIRIEYRCGGGFKDFHWELKDEAESA